MSVLRTAGGPPLELIGLLDLDGKHAELLFLRRIDAADDRERLLPGLAQLAADGTMRFASWKAGPTEYGSAAQVRCIG